MNSVFVLLSFGFLLCILKGSCSSLESFPDNENTSVLSQAPQATNELSSENVQRQVVTIFNVPETLFGYILTFLYLPWKTLPLVSKTLNEMMKTQTPRKYLCASSLLRNQADYLSDGDIKILLRLGHLYLGDRFDMIIKFFYSIKLSSTYFIEENIAAINLNADDEDEKNDDLSDIFDEMIDFDNYHFDLILIIMRTGLTIYFSYKCLYKFLKDVLSNETTFTENISLFMQSVTHFQNQKAFLEVLLSFPNIPNFEVFLPWINSFGFSSKELFPIIINSFLLIKSDEYSNEELEIIKNRNLNLFEMFPKDEDTDFNIFFSRLCANMISKDFQDEPLSPEVLQMVNENDHKYCMHDSIFSKLMRISVNNRLVQIFCQIYNISNFSNEYLYARSGIEKHPEFIQLLPFDIYKKILSRKDPLKVYKNINFCFDFLGFNEDEFLKLLNRLERENISESFKIDINHYFSIHPSYIGYFIWNIVEYSGNSARNVFIFLSLIQNISLSKKDLNDISNGLSTNRFISSLFKVENVDIFNFDIKDVKIKISENEFRLFINFANQLETEALASFLKYIQFQWQEIFHNNNFRRHDYELFFGVLGFKKEHFQILKPGNSEEEQIVLKIINDSTVLYSEPDVYAKYLGAAVLDVILNPNARNYPSISCSKLFNYQLSGIYEFLMEINLEGFFTYAPEDIITAFNPIIPYYLIKNVLLHAKDSIILADRILSPTEEFGDLKTHRISISSVYELEIYFSSFYPNLFKKYSGKLYLQVFIDWETIINYSDESNFQFITEALKLEEFEEKVLKFKRSDKIHAFMNYFEQNKILSGTKTINTEYLNAFRNIGLLN